MPDAAAPACRAAAGSFAVGPRAPVTKLAAMAADQQTPVLDLSMDPADLTAALVDVESVSDHEGPLADAVEAALRELPHLTVHRDGDTVVARTERIRMGNPLDTDTMMGAQASSDQLEKILSYLDIGRQEGAEVLTGGERAVLDGVADGSPGAIGVSVGGSGVGVAVAGSGAVIASLKRIVRQSR